MRADRSSVAGLRRAGIWQSRSRAAKFHVVDISCARAESGRITGLLGKTDTCMASTLLRCQIAKARVIYMRVIRLENVIRTVAV